MRRILARALMAREAIVEWDGCFYRWSEGWHGPLFVHRVLESGYWVPGDGARVPAEWGEPPALSPQEVEKWQAYFGRAKGYLEPGVLALVGVPRPLTPSGQHDSTGKQAEP